MKMKRTGNLKVMIPVMVLILAAVVLLKIFAPESMRSGIRLGFIGNDGIHKFNGKYSKITGTSTHTLSPSKDSDTIHCVITTKSGSLNIRITEKGDGNVVYEKNIDGDAEFDVKADGKVKIVLSTEGHSGSYLFQY